MSDKGTPANALLDRAFDMVALVLLCFSHRLIGGLVAYSRRLVRRLTLFRSVRWNQDARRQDQKYTLGDNLERNGDRVTKCKAPRPRTPQTSEHRSQNKHVYAQSVFKPCCETTSPPHDPNRRYTDSCVVLQKNGHLNFPQDVSWVTSMNNSGSVLKVDLPPLGAAWTFRNVTRTSRLLQRKLLLLQGRKTVI